MTRSPALLVATLLVGVTLRADAQSSRAIEGTWTRAATGGARAPSVATSGSAAFTVGTMGSGWGDTLTFANRGSRWVLEYPYFSAYDGQAPLHIEFGMESDVENLLTIGPERTRLQARAAWHGDTLLVTTRQPVPREVAPASVMAEVRRALVLVSPDTLRVTTTRVGVAGGATNVVNTTYARRH